MVDKARLKKWLGKIEESGTVLTASNDAVEPNEKQNAINELLDVMGEIEEEITTIESNESE